MCENTADEKVKFSFHKYERLCSKKVIDKLFLEGKSIFVFPVKIVYLETPLSSNFKVQAAFTVGKRNFKRAVQRNLIKRRMRESYRLNKNELYQNLEDKQVAVFFIFTGKAIPDYHMVEAAIKKGIKKLIREVSLDK